MTVDFIKGLIVEHKVNIEFNIDDYDWQGLHELLTAACENDVSIKLNVSKTQDYYMVQEVLNDVTHPGKKNITVRFIG